MEIGDYVRTKQGYIAKIIDIDSECDFISCDEIILFNGYEEYSIIWGEYLEMIVKSSPNIIDLIEVGDYVNGKLVKKIYDKTSYADKCLKLLSSNDYYYSEDIKTILTHEQFDSIKYEVK